MKKNLITGFADPVRFTFRTQRFSQSAAGFANDIARVDDENIFSNFNHAVHFGIESGAEMDFFKAFYCSPKATIELLFGNEYKQVVQSKQQLFSTPNSFCIGKILPIRYLIFHTPFKRDGQKTSHTASHLRRLQAKAAETGTHPLCVRPKRRIDPRPATNSSRSRRLSLRRPGLPAAGNEIAGFQSPVKDDGSI